jgi:DNA-binding CsgD family transcriptional regulator
MVSGSGDVEITTQLVDLAANAALALVLVRIVSRYFARAPARLAEARAGAPTLTPQLALAMGAPPPPPLARAAAGDLTRSLSEAECRVLALLAGGRAPKQAAAELCVSLSTVRSQLASAKRKTGARTLEQLVALFAEATDGD